MVLSAPSTFRVIAIISTYNEEDIIVPVVNHLVKEGISVYVIDNWSTDRTYKLLNELSPSLFGLERFPEDGPSKTFDWGEILKRKEMISRTFDADWFIHHDADEIRNSPWPGVTLRDAIYLVDQQGYNAIDFHLLNFYPIDNDFQYGMDPVKHFEYFRYSEIVGNLLQIKAWKRLEKPHIVRLVYGGHAVESSNRKIYPIKFILRHYPIRSQQHGDKKVFVERIGRFNPTEKKEKGWHVQYDHIDSNHSFITDPSTLIKFDESVYIDLLMKQLLELSQSYQQINADLMERDELIQNLNNKITEQEQTIQSLTANLTEQEQTIQSLEQEVLFYATSKSWRITRPLRKFVKLAKRIIQTE